MSNFILGENDFLRKLYEFDARGDGMRGEWDIGRGPLGIKMSWEVLARMITESQVTENGG